MFGTTTVKNDRVTLDAVHEAYTNAIAIANIKRVNIKTMSWTLVLQPLLPYWGQKVDNIRSASLTTKRSHWLVLA